MSLKPPYIVWTSQARDERYNDILKRTDLQESAVPRIWFRATSFAALVLSASEVGPRWVANRMPRAQRRTRAGIF